MATHDYSIANQSFPATRSDLNNALTAIKSSNSDSTAPTTSLVAGQLFYDTSSTDLKVYDGSSFGSVGIDTTAALALTNATSSTSTTTGALKVAGGVSTQENLWVGGTSNSADTLTCSKASGTGLSVTSNATVGGTLAVTTSTTTPTVGLDSTDYISWTNNAQTDFYINNLNKFRMEADGDFHADGDVVAYSTTISDERLKTGISTVSNALEKVSQLNGVEFTRKNNGQRSAGVIAQEVEKVLPQAIREKKLPLQTGEEDTLYKTVEYDALHSLYIEAIKELKQQLDDQALEIKELKKG